MKRKLFIPLYEDEVAPRFDLATEVLTAECSSDGLITKDKMLILPGPSAERLCHLIITEAVQVVICGGIEQELYDYLTWKRVQVIDNVIGPSKSVLKRFSTGELSPGDIVTTADN
jgi:predicted Fe-Mo cluster-binding NifX family protein